VGGGCHGMIVFLMNISEQRWDGNFGWIVAIFFKLSFSEEVDGCEGNYSSEGVKANGLESSLVIGYKLERKDDGMLREDCEVYDIESDESDELYAW